MVILIAGCKTKNENTTIDSQKANELNDKGVGFLMNSELDSALTLFDQAIKADKNFYKPYLNKASVFIKMKDFEKALAECETSLEKKSDYPEGIFMAGILCELTDKPKKAENYYRKSIDSYTQIINESNDSTVINAYKMSKAISKLFIGDQTYLNDLAELQKIEDFKITAMLLSKMTKDQLMEDIFNN